MAKTANKVTIVGAGFVGSTIAYTLVNAGTVSEIVLVDVDNARAEGEAMDIEHGSPFFKESLIHAGDYETAAGSDIVIITAGTNQRPGETRMDLITRNAAIVKNVAKEIKKTCPEAIILVVANPVDVMTRVIQEVTGFPAERVIGSGTNLDSARLRYLLGKKFGIDSRNIHAYVLGEHGDSEFVAWSNVNIAGMNINEASDSFGGIMGDYDYIDLANETRDAAYEIINRKKATYYGIAASAARICEAILRDEKSILPLSVKLTGQYGLSDVYLSLPTVVGQHGVVKVIAPYLSEEEEGKLHHSAKLLAEAYDSLQK
ncbi:MAG: L-lactate dehydrogenase [Candidatus Saccharibacteria bacterium]|nr:L-lactate dehydrogenase [Candidatus Saccharibacteria bacterium]